MYVRAIRTGIPRGLAESQGFPWDPGLWDGVCASTGGVRSAALAALEEGAAGSLSSGLHHARHDHGAGFCTFNGLALAALRAKQLTAGRVLILDLDAHCGGGTYSLIQTRMIGVDHLDVSLNRFDSYTPDAKDELEVVRAADRYLYTIRAALTRQHRCDLVIYNAGMDGFEGCDTGGMDGITEDVLAQRERLVFDWAAGHGYPIAFVLAGGYVGRDLSKAILVRLHRLTLQAASNAYGGRGCERGSGVANAGGADAAEPGRTDRPTGKRDESRCRAECPAEPRRASRSGPTPKAAAPSG
jgi:acetoin utilization deacetylase AcuC-like enzyme